MFKRINKNWSFVARNFTHKCLCILCALLIISFNAVPSHAVVATLGAITTAAEAGNTVGELFGRVLEDFFGLNHQCTLTEATLITINRSLDAIFSNTYGYDIVNPYTGNNDTINVSGRNFGKMLADMNNSIATLGVRFLRPINNNITSVGNSITNHTQQMNNALYENQHIGQSAYSVGAQTYNINRALRSDLWSTLSYSPKYYDSSFNELTYTAYQNVGTDMYISTPDNTSILPNAILHIKLPISYMSNIQYLEIEFSNYRYGEIIVPYYYVIPSMWEVDLYYISPFNAVGSTYIHLHNDYGLRFTDTGISGQPLCEYIGPNNARYKEYLSILFDYQNHRELMDVLSNMQVTAEFDDTDILDAINDISLVDNDVKLTPVIDADLPTNGTNIVNRLRLFFSTGVTVTEFFTEVDNAETDWYSQENSDVINTLSGGYVDLYE